MRKAAGLLVEMPPDEEDDFGAQPGGDLDALLAKSEEQAARLGQQDGAQNTAEPKTVEQIVREAEGPNLDEIKVVAPPASVAGGTGGSLDFGAIYNAAKLTPSSFGAEQMLEMLTSMPAELPLKTKRATIKAMLSTIGKNVGATPETVVADASRKLAALAAYADFLSKKTGEFTAKSETEIAELEAQVDAKKTAIQNARAEQARITTACETESDRLDDILEFFSLDVAPSKYAPTPENAPKPA